MADALIGPVFILVLAGVGAALPAWLAHRRGRSAVIWGGVGVLMPLLSILLVILLGHKRTADA